MRQSVLKSSLAERVKEYVLLTAGVLSYALGWSVFLLPHNLVGGGVSGFASILYYATGVPMGLTYFIVNVILLIIGTRILGRGFGAKTIYAIIATSVLLAVMPSLVPEEIINGLSFDNSKLICTCIGGLIAGFGIGLSISQGGSTGGTDIVALLWCKFHPASPGRVILLIDIVIILSSLLFPSYTTEIVDGQQVSTLLPFTEKLLIVIYGLLQVTVSGFAVDMYLSGSKQSVQAFIFTKKSKEMADAIAYDMKRGVTMIPAKGWYTKEDRDVLMVVTRKADLNLLLRYVKSIDPDAFLSISTVMGVYGQGFDTLKVKTRK
ncbi:MAG: YitT family protein [Bacteroidales bacterium]|nr:YitT family protein [Bacteroidales bacterium]